MSEVLNVQAVLAHTYVRVTKPVPIDQSGLQRIVVTKLHDFLETLPKIIDVTNCKTTGTLVSSKGPKGIQVLNLKM